MIDRMDNLPTSAPYLGRLGLGREPFAAESQNEFFLLDSERAQRLNMLYHLSQNSELLLLVTGVHGSGKSSLLHRFLEMGNEGWRNCNVDANAMMNPEQLLTEIAEGFGLPQHSINFGTVFEALRKRLVELKRSELIAILTVDDAHELPAASLTVLIKLSELVDNDDNEGLLRIVLFSEPQITDMLNARELKEVRHRITHTLSMPQLDQQQTTDYISYRLSVAGLQGEPPFSRSQLKRIHKLSDGIPGKINLYAHEMLLGVQPPELDDIVTPKAGRLRAMTSMLLILLIAGGITWLFARDAFDTLLAHLNNSQPDQVALETTSKLPLLPPTKHAPVVAAKIEPVTAQTPDKTASIEPVGKPKNIKPTVPVKSGKPDQLATTATQAINPYAIPKVINNKPVTGKPHAVIEKPPQKIATAPEQVRTATKKPTPRPKPVGSNWLASKNPNHFTLQLMGSRSTDAVKKIIRNHKLRDKAAVIRTVHEGANWHILVYGDYPNKEKARAAVSSLPAALRLSRPWPRRIGDIKAVK